MNLSDAIRLGSTITEQTSNVLISHNGLSSCALRAAIIGSGWIGEPLDLYINGKEQAYLDLRDKFPILNEQIIIDFVGKVSLVRYIWAMNDSYEKSREEIANEVEKL